MGGLSTCLYLDLHLNLSLALDLGLRTARSRIYLGSPGWGQSTVRTAWVGDRWARGCWVGQEMVPGGLSTCLKLNLYFGLILGVEFGRGLIRPGIQS